MLLYLVLKGKLQKIHDLIKDSQPPVGNIAEVVELREAMNGEVEALHKSLLTKLEKVMEVSESSHPELQRVRELTSCSDACDSGDAGRSRRKSWRWRLSRKASPHA